MSKIQQILNSAWAVGRSDYLNLLSILKPAVDAGNFAAVEKELSKEPINVMCVNLGYAYREWEFEDENLPNDSISVVRMDGVLYNWDTEYLARCIGLALENTKIAGVILKIDGVGGMINGLGELTSLIENAAKPIVAVVTGCCMSAHYWIASTAKRRLLLDKGCQVGSIGVVGTYYNASEAMKNAGIDFREIYPDTSDLKNIEIRDIEKNNDERRYKKYLEKIHALFCDTVSRNLSIPYEKESPVFRGATFMGDEAIKAGLADGYGNVDDAARWILAQSIRKRTENIV